MKELIPYLVIIPLFAGLLIPVLARLERRLSGLIGNLGILAALVISGLLFGESGEYLVGGWSAPIGIVLRVDMLSVLLLWLIGVVGICSGIYSVKYMERYTGSGSYWGLFLLMIAGMNGVVVSGDLFNLYIFLEIASIASYALVGFKGEAEELEASFKYAVLSSVGSLFFLLGIGVLYLAYGTVNMGQLAGRLSEEAGAVNLKHFGVVLLISGVSLKSALVPFHSWLADAHPSAPAPVSAMLSGVLIKAIGIYVLVRVVFNIYGFNRSLSYLLLALGALSMVGGVLLAIGQWDYKRLLAYHSISQIGYVIIGIGLGTPLGIMGGIYHLINHGIFKGLLFLSAGAVEYSAGTRDLREMGGLSQRLPVTSGASLIGSLSISGIPPFNGFFSKLIIIFACIEARYYGVAIAAVIVSILTLASFMKVLRYGFYGRLNERFEGLREAPFSMRVAMLVLIILCLGMSVLILPLLREMVLVEAEKVLSQGIGLLAMGL